MEDDDFPVYVFGFLPDGFIQGLKAFLIRMQVFQNFRLPVRHQADQPFRQVCSHTGSPLGIQPEMGIDFLALFGFADFDGV